MADNTSFYASLDPAAPKVLDKEVDHSGDTAKLQYIGLGEALGSEGSRTFREFTALDTLLESLIDLVTAANAATTTAATTTPVASGTGDAQILPATANLRLLGFTSKEDTGSASAEFVLRHGTSASDPPLAHVTLGSNESTRDWFGPGGMIASSGIYLDRISGTTEISIQTVVAS